MESFCASVLEITKSGDSRHPRRLPSYSLLMSKFVIREAKESDLGQILELYRDAGIDAGNSFTPDEARDQLAVLGEYPNYRVFVAELGGTVVGTYELLIMDNLAKRGRRSAIVEDVAVANQQRGQGIGRAMMEHAMQQARDAECYKLALSSNLRRPGAHAFYEALGFKKHGYSFLVEIS